MAKGLDCGTSYYITATEDSIKKQKNESKGLKDIGGVVSIPALGDFLKDK